MKILPVLLFLVLVHASLAENPSIKQEPLPPGPLIQRIPDFSSWRVTFSYAQDQAEPSEKQKPDLPARDDTFFLSSAPRTLTITRTNPRWLAVFKDTKGNILEQCFDGQRIFISGEMDKGAVLQGAYILTADVATGEFEKHIDFSKTDFPDMEWISKETYKGIQRENGNTLLVFESNGITVWIDSKTRLPVLWKKEGETRTFEQLPRPTKVVDLPPQADALAQAIKKDLERLKRPGPPKMLPPLSGRN